MTGFIIKTSDNKTIRFKFYKEDAPITCSAFQNLIPSSTYKAFSAIENNIGTKLPLIG